MDRPKLHKGRFRGTDSYGNDSYAADYYSKHEVDEYIIKLEAKLDAVRPYIDHKKWCLKRDPTMRHESDCNCELQQALGENDV